MRSNSLIRWIALLIPLMFFMARPALAQKYVCMQSLQGEWCMQLLPSAAPATVSNFLRYVNGGLYTNNLVHRSVPGFVIQGGGFNIDTNNKINAVPTFGTVNNEFNRSNLRGTVAMAKLGGDPNSATSQWFVNLANNTFLDTPANGSFTVFANVVYGMDTVDKIAGLQVVDESSVLGSVFNEIPLVPPVNPAQPARQNLVLITRAYTTDLLPGSTAQPYHCSAPVANDALTELCGSSVTFPVSVLGGGAYELSLDLIATQPTLVFSVRPGSLKAITNLPDSYATFNPLTNVAVIPSVRSGAAIYDNVQLLMTNPKAQQLTLQSFSRR